MRRLSSETPSKSSIRGDTLDRSTKRKSSAVSSIIKKIELDEYSNTSSETDDFVYLAVATGEDKIDCLKLVHDVYRAKNFVVDDNYKTIKSSYDEQPSTLIVAAKNSKNEIVATLTIVSNEKYLPCYEVFKDEVNNLKNKKLAEITRLAITKDYRKSTELLKGLFNFVYVYSYQLLECDVTLIEVNPRHVQYYKRYLFFNILSKEQNCSRVQNGPAILLGLKLSTFQAVENGPNKFKKLKRSFYCDIDERKPLFSVIRENIMKATNNIAKTIEDIEIDTIQQFTKIVGAKNIKTEFLTRQEYGRSTLESGTIPKIIIQPENQKEIRKILALSNKIKWEVHPISTGKNWGYSDACALNDGVILLDLKRMNKILSFDNEVGTIVVEPGVTQGQVASFLENNHHPFMMDATGAGPDTSLIGNTAERGFGHSPNGDRFANSCGYEIVLANGEVFQTGFGSFKNSEVTDIYKWGVGPSLDGLFTQSNLGVITKMTFWLMPKPECFKVAYFMLKKNSDISAFIDHIRPLRMDGTLKSVIHIGNDLRILSMSQSYPWEEMKGVTPMDPQLREKLIEKSGLGAWSGTAGLYGSKEQVNADIKRIKKALKSFKGLKKMIFLGQNQINLISLIGQKIKNFSFGKKLHQMSHKIKMAFDLLKGQSPETCVQGGLWRLKNQKDIVSVNSNNPLDYNAGFYWISPILPMKGSHVTALQKLVEPIFNYYGFDLQQTLSMTNERSLSSVMTISYDKSNKREASKARTCHDKVVDALTNAGYILYRAGNHTMKALENRGESYNSVLVSIKKALDPNNILSPGKYIPLTD
ncbi:MAG: hypothetical protein COA79_17930 [Planctomycetota bacterium]|nr:MAG: hypothetical protein COA79_17930 [Planctomycetota bacterium]